MCSIMGYCSGDADFSLFKAGFDKTLSRRGNMEQKKVTYTGVDTEDVTEQLEQGNAKLAEKGWREYRVDMLSSSAVRVTYVRGELEEDEELPLDGEEE